MGSIPKIFLARSFITMDDTAPRVSAVAVNDGVITAVGELEEVATAVGPDYQIDDTFAKHTVMTGFIDQHLHPFLAASTLTTEIIAPEDWVMPDRVHVAAATPGEFDERVIQAHQGLDDGEWL